MDMSFSKAAEVFAIPELLELILLSLPTSSTQVELSSIRTILTCRLVCNTWHKLVKDSACIRAFCYLPQNKHAPPSSTPSLWDKPSPTPTLIRHNPYISSLLLRHRHCGGAWPFNGDDQTSLYGSTEPQYWSYFFEVSRSESERFPTAGPWREMLATNPPFHEAWCTLTTQMTAIDSLLYGSPSRDRDEALTDEDLIEGLWTPRMEAECRLKGYQQSRGKQFTKRKFEGGFTMGALVDVVGEMFARDEKAEWVVVESVRVRDVYMENEPPGWVNWERGRWLGITGEVINPI